MADRVPTVLTHPLFANLLVEAAADMINAYRTSDSPEEVGSAVQSTVETLCALFLDMGDALDHVVKLPEGWSLAEMTERLYSVLRDDPDVPAIPEGLPEVEHQTAVVVFTFNRFLECMVNAFGHLAEEGRVDPMGDLSDFVSDPSVQLEIATWTTLILGPKEDAAASDDAAQ